MKRACEPHQDPPKQTGAALYNKMVDYVLSEREMRDNGYPRPDPASSGRVTIKWQGSNQQRFVVKGHTHICQRCDEHYQVPPNAQYPRGDGCVYHWGQCWKRRFESNPRWSCCQRDSRAGGCSVAEYHVHARNKATDLTGYVKTKPQSKSSGDYGVYSLDCERINTTFGSELARVSVIGPDMGTVYEKLVKPEHTIIDYNTRFSGITKTMLQGVETTLSDVQDDLMGLFSDKTIIMGHSLEGDFIALKMIHNTVVDTSVVFPHRRGPPYKRGLRALMEEILHKTIQNNGANGHDSKEDACACMELMLWKVKEDIKRQKRC